MPDIQHKEEEEMGEKDSVRSRKRLIMFGMFSLVLVTFVATFLTLAVIMRTIDPAFYGGSGIIQMALVPSLIVTAIAVVVCVIGWFVYTKVLLKE
jgi:uncharacterized membrane protein YdbT with pleckstrin-like domain